METETMTGRRVYIADLAAYNAGTLYGRWVDVTDSETMQAEIAAMLAESPEHGEEWALHDYDGEWYGFGAHLGESPDLDVLCALSDLLEQHGEPWAAYVANTCGGDLRHAVEAGSEDFEEAYAGEWSSQQEYAENLLDDLGELKDGSLASRYFDYEAFTRDLFMSDYWSEETAGGVFVFRNI